MPKDSVRYEATLTDRLRGALRKLDCEPEWNWPAMYSTFISPITISESLAPTAEDSKQLLDLLRSTASMDDALYLLRGYVESHTPGKAAK